MGWLGISLDVGAVFGKGATGSGSEAVNGDVVGGGEEGVREREGMSRWIRYTGVRRRVKYVGM